MSVIIHDMTIPKEGCLGCVLAHNVFNGDETVLACPITGRQADEEGNRPDWCPLEDLVTCYECKYSVMTMSGLCKYCRLEEDEDGNLEKQYYPGDYFCGCGERRISEITI